jgi:hypothetical protein
LTINLLRLPAYANRANLSLFRRYGVCYRKLIDKFKALVLLLQIILYMHRSTNQNASFVELTYIYSEYYSPHKNLANENALFLKLDQSNWNYVVIFHGNKLSIIFLQFFNISVKSEIL